MQSQAITIYKRGVRRASTAYVQPNWLEKNCGNVPTNPRILDTEVSKMLRGGHAIQTASANLFDAKAADFHTVNVYSAAHSDKLKELRDAENKALQRIDEAVLTKEMRFRPSLAIPAIKLCSFAVGCALSPLGDSISTSYVTGVKMAASEYYNDQIREIHANNPDMVELKELFKEARDEEQEFVDAHTPDILAPNKESQDPVATFAKLSLKLLTQVACKI